MCAQVRQGHPTAATPGEALVARPFGLPSQETQVDLRSYVYKELINKIAWALGSTYRVNYSNVKMPARQYANRIAGKVISDHGFPHSIKK